ncbi:DUF4890 domain-containing protein [Olivibacter sp. XZL3]|uniref:DUF4890 domain-containing protein n=1 Tax=Olivibacter sp. XZL3 TaxID=1735116 RepID=UPI00106627E3|nr:DUF4890 domain-containing protein [Olivibacter sp. XZL3]
MKKMILSALLFIGMGSMAFAQQDDYKRKARTAEERAKRSTELLAEKLSLSEDQKKEIYAINLDNIKKMDVERKKGMQAHKDLMQKSVTERNEKINSVLTDAQKSAYQDLKKERFQERKHRGRIKSDSRRPEQTPQL